MNLCRYEEFKCADLVLILQNIFANPIFETQSGNPDGPDSPNKKYYDPRVWLRKGEETMIARLKLAFEDLNCINQLG